MSHDIEGIPNPRSGFGVIWWAGGRDRATKPCAIIRVRAPAVTDATRADGCPCMPGDTLSSMS